MVKKSVMLQLCQSLLAFVTLLCLTGTSVRGQDDSSRIAVKDVIWGFDGRVAAGQFNPLSILIDNLSADAYELKLTLHRQQGMLAKSGGELVQTAFVGGQSRRWVQFYPYVANSYGGEWILNVECSDPEFQFELTKLTEARISNPIQIDPDEEKVLPQAIILDPVGSPSNIPITVKHLAENNFPPFATATHGLKVVFLDHMPDWEYPRQDAFMAWLKRGGRLFVLRDGRGQVPQFTERMVELNRPQTRFALGSGAVVVRDYQRNQLTKAKFQTAMNFDRRLKNELEDEIQNAQFGQSASLAVEDSSINELFFREMRENTFPNHSWLLIFLLAFAYVGLIFPGCFFLSKKRTIHYTATYGAIVGSAIVFSLLFLFVGRRGYGEKTNLQTLAVATAVDADAWDVFQWNAFFVVDGDTYLAEAPREQTLFSSANQQEPQGIQVFAGTDGRAEMKIPPYASQTFVCRRMFQGRLGRAKIRSMAQRDSGLVALELIPDADFDLTGIHECAVAAGKRVYRMTVDQTAGLLRLQGKKQDLGEFCRTDSQYGYYQNPWMVYEDDERTDEQIFLDESLSALARRSLRDFTDEPISGYELPADRLRLFVYRELPEQLSLTMSAESKSTGRVLVVQDLFPDRPSDRVTKQTADSEDDSVEEQMSDDADEN